ncbi:MAG: hypothetical protein LDL33_04240 [Desulfomonile sp.]|nr:hypothetical protein [Desulfomonile sp.]
MRVRRVLLLAGVMFLIAQLCAIAAEPKKTRAGLLGEAMKAIEAGRTPLAKEKLIDLLRLDPENYAALLLLGQLEMTDLGGADTAKKIAGAENYLLQAAIAQPQRAEAYLGLAALAYETGYIDRGDYYARIAQDVDPKSYQSFGLLGQRYEDSGNFAGAVDQYQRALTVYGFDPYLTERRYLAATRGGLQPEWTYPLTGKVPVAVPRAGAGPSPAAAPTKGPAVTVLFLRRYPDYYLLNEYRKESGRDPSAAKRFVLPLFQPDYCPRDVIPSNPYKDLYEAFIKASVTDPAQYTRLRQELDRIRSEALKAVAHVQGVNAKGRALYKWLKANVLKQYDAQDGAFAQGILEQKKYASLSGAILYALIAQEAGLPVTGTVTAGHALVLLNDGKRKIPVDIAAGMAKDVPEEAGFDAVWWDQFKMRDILDDQGVPQASIGAKISPEVRPAGLLAYQHMSANESGLERIEAQFKEEVAYKKTLEDMIMQSNREAATRVASIRARLYADPDRAKIELEREQRKFQEDLTRYQKELQKANATIEKEKARYYSERGLNLLRTARALAPRLEEAIQREEEAFVFIARAEARPALEAIENGIRMRRQVEKQLTEKLDDLELEKALSGPSSSTAVMLQSEIEVVETELTRLDETEIRDWQTERGAWLKALKVLESGIQSLPCSEHLKKRLEAFCWAAVTRAEKARDAAAIDEVIRIGTSRLPTSEFARKHQEQRLGRM